MSASSSSHPVRAAFRFVGMVLVALLALQLFFALRIAAMRIVPPASTTFQRSEIVRLLVEKHALAWSQDWVDRDRISTNLQRAVIASEDAGFVDHHGVEWDALEKSWKKNEKAEARAEAATERAAKRVKPGASTPKPVAAKVVGGSTISQQLAKNLFLSSERTLLRKGQEFVITLMLEVLLGKQRILTVYLNSVEWGEGVFGAEAAAHHYFHVDAAHLAPLQAARLAVMLPAPKRFEKQPASAYLVGRAGTIAARMGDVDLP
jgi:monofunctional biosynthetic peptidoglycan transglycosylase